MIQWIVIIGRFEILFSPFKYWLRFFFFRACLRFLWHRISFFQESFLNLAGTQIFNKSALSHGSLGEKLKLFPVVGWVLVGGGGRFVDGVLSL